MEAVALDASHLPAELYSYMFVREGPSSGPVSLAPVSAKSSKNARFKVFFELFC
jgi:hypothetical protein